MAKTSGGVRKQRPKSVAEEAKEKILTVLSDIKRIGYSRIPPFKIGSVEKRMSTFAERNDIKLASRDVYMSASAIAHATRSIKQTKGIAVSDMDLVSFPSRRKKMDLYYDTRIGNFTYTDGKTKYIMHPSYETKTSKGKTKLVYFITASKVNDKNEFRMKEYKRIR